MRVGGETRFFDGSNVPQFGHRHLGGLASSTNSLEASGSDFRRRRTMQCVMEVMIPMAARLPATAPAIISTDGGSGRFNSRKQPSSQHDSSQCICTFLHRSYCHLGWSVFRQFDPSQQRWTAVSWVVLWSRSTR